jgi:hypothetical protein
MSAKHFLCGALLVGATLAATGSAFAGGNNLGTPKPGALSETAAGDRWAVVNRDGTLARFKGAVSSGRGDTSSGSYIVKFNRDVTYCMYQATIGLPGSVGVELPGEITVVRRFNEPRAVYITTHDSSGKQTDRSFHLYIGCN